MADNGKDGERTQGPFWKRAWKPLAVVIVAHLGIVLGYSAFFGFNLSCFLNVGAAFPWADAKHFAPGVIKYTEIPGYDGSDYYLVARDPLLLSGDIAPSYKLPSKFMRYQRFVYPLLVNLLTCDHPRYFPHAMLFINFASAVGITIVLMKMLARRGASPWLSLIFVLSGGMLFAFSLDLQMHLCFLCIVAALYYYDAERIELSALLFAVALMTWENAILFAGPIGLWELLHRRRRNTAFFLAILVPFLYSQAYFASKLGEKMLSGSSVALGLPFMGMLRSVAQILRSGFDEGTIKLLRNLLVIPAIALFVAMFATASWKSWRRRDNVYNFLLLVQVLFIVFLDKRVLDTFTNVMRINAGVFLPLVLSYRNQKDGASPWLFGGGIVLAVLALLRIFATVHAPYVLIGAV